MRRSPLFAASVATTIGLGVGVLASAFTILNAYVLRPVDLPHPDQQVRVQRSAWKGHINATKGGRVRFVPLTVRLTAALRDRRHLHSARVLC